MSHDVSVELVREWLRQSGRDLTAVQLDVVNEALRHCSLPLYTSLVFEEASTEHWRKLGTKFGGTNFFLAVPQIEKLGGGRRRTHYILELNDNLLTKCMVLMYG